MKKIHLAIIILCSTTFSQAQVSPEIEKKYYDLLEGNINHKEQFEKWFEIKDDLLASGDSIKIISCLTTLSSFYDYKDQQDSSIALNKEALKWTSNDRDKYRIESSIAKNLSKTYPEKGDSLFNALYTNPVAMSDSTTKVTVLGNYAGLKLKKGDIQHAIDLMIESTQNMTHDYPISSQYAQIANSFLLLKNLDRAHEYVLKSIELKEKNNYKSRHLSTSILYGKILYLLDRKEEAFLEVQKSIDFCKKENRNIDLAKAFNMMSQLHWRDENYDLSKFYCLKAVDLKDKLNPSDYCEIMLQYCHILLKDEKFDEILPLGEDIKGIALNNNLPLKLKSVHRMLSRTHESIDNSKRALEEYKEFVFWEDSLYRRDQGFAVARIESDFNRKQQDQAIAYLNTENELKADKLSAQKMMLWLGGGFLVLISGLSFFLFRLNRKVQEQNVLITKALNEKDVLLREIHHRVKNNLQLVSSLLGLQSRYIDDPNALQAINSGQARVRSMALIHQDLYNKENLTGVSIKDYLEKLCKELVSTYNINTDRVRLKMDIEDLQLDVDTLVPLGLIINELLTNSLKYAFPNNREGTIDISIRESENQLSLEVSDNGIGFDSEKIGHQSFGNRLIKTLVEQLEGNLLVENNEGTSVKIYFREYKKAA